MGQGGVLGTACPPSRWPGVSNYPPLAQGAQAPSSLLVCTASLPARSSPLLADAVCTRRWVQANYFHYFLLISALHSSRALKTLHQQEYANLRLGHRGTAQRSGGIGDSCCPLSEEDWCGYHHACWQEEGGAGLLRSLPIWEGYEYPYQLRVILRALFITKMTQIQ